MMDMNGESKEGVVQTKSFAFAVRVVNAYKYLSTQKKEYVMSKQLLRSGTAIGALVTESGQAESKNDFIHKKSIALKEAKETESWLKLLHKTEYLNKTAFSSLHADTLELIKLLTSIIKSMKSKK